MEGKGVGKESCEIHSPDSMHPGSPMPSGLLLAAFPLCLAESNC
jgi:hypothetical protein